MFKKALTARFKHKIECEIATENGAQKIEFLGIFKRADQDAVDQMVSCGMPDDQVVRSQLVGWEGVPEDPPFDEGNLAAALAIDGMRAVIARAFFAGNSTATRKN